MERLSAPERTREELRALMNGELGTAAGWSDLVRLAPRLIVEEALEGEVADVLGRERYERGDGEKAGYRTATARRSLAFRASMAFVTGMRGAGAEDPAAGDDCGVWCDHPGQRRREHEGVGRPFTHDEPRA